MSRRSLQCAPALRMLVVLAAFAAAGCGGSDKSSDSATPASDEPITLTVWDGGGMAKDAFTEVNDEYMRMHPNVTVKRVIQPSASFNTLVRSAIAAQEGPDAIQSFGTPAIFDFQRGLEPLGDLVTDEDRENLIGWKGLSANLSEDGQPYGIPWSGQGIVPYYNKALFAKAGLDPESPPSTWDELLSACDTLSGAGIIPIAAGFKDGYYAEWLVEMLGPQYQTEEELAQGLGDPDWESEANERALELIKELEEKNCFTPNSEGIPLFPDAVNNFKSGKGAMFVGLVASAVNWSEFRGSRIGKDLGVFLAPLVPDSLWSEPRLNYGPGLSWVITRWSPNKQATYDYLSYMASAEVQDKLFAEIGMFPNNRQSRPETDDEVGAQLLEWATEGDPYVGMMTLIRANVEAAFDKTVPQVITGRMSPADALAQTQAEQDKAAPIPTK